MKVLAINSGNFGSTGNIMLDINDQLKKSGHQAYSSCSDGRSMRKKKLEDHIYIGNIVELNLHLNLACTTGKAGMYSKIGTRKFLDKVDKIAPDIIHLHNLHNSYINLEMLFSYIKKNRIKVVWTLHDCWSFTGHCPHFDMVDCNKWKVECYDCPQFKEYPRSRIDNSKFMYKLKKKWFTGVENLTIVTPSQWLGDLVKQSFLKEYPVKVINNGIDLEVFKPTKSDFREIYNCKNKIILLGVAFGWGKRKGLDIFIELAKVLEEKYQIVLVGTDEDIDKVLPKNIISIHRTQNQKELAEIYSAADLFFNPTREEVFGLVNVEALACGTPVITFNSGGSPECINKTCGIVVEKDDLFNSINSIDELLNKRVDKEMCINRAFLFKKNEKYQEYINLYEEKTI